MKFQKKRVIVDAYQTDKDMYIETLEGVMHASPGDWIITGVNGETLGLAGTGALVTGLVIAETSCLMGKLVALAPLSLPRACSLALESERTFPQKLFCESSPYNAAPAKKAAAQTRTNEAAPTAIRFCILH